MKVLSVLGLLWIYIIPITAKRLGESTSSGNIVEVLSTVKGLSSLVGLISEKNLTDTLATGGNFTVFAPTNYAFEKITSRLNGLTDAQITDVLLYHVTQGKVLSGDLSDGQEIVTLRPDSNAKVSIKKKGWWKPKYVIYINEAKVIKEDIEASNGVIHIITDVLFPDDLVFNTIVDVLGDYGGTFNKLVGLLIDYNLTDTLRSTENLTLIAPSDYAFGKIKNELKRLNGDDGATMLTNILKYHVIDSSVESDQLVDGQEYSTLYPNDTITVSKTEEYMHWWSWKTVEVIKFNDAKVYIKDIEASNGFVHKVDKVLLPPSVDIPSTIVDFAAADEKLTKLVELLTNSSLIDTLEGPGQFTVFAPTNEAFDDISSTLETKTPEEIRDILLYHVVGEEVFSSDLSDGQTLDTLFVSNSLTVSTKKYGGRWCSWFGYYCKTRIEINDSEVKKADIDASNGVIHVIDKVLLPS